MPDKVTAPRVRAMKTRGEKVVCVTAYDAILGRLADRSGVDVVLVGDSVGNTVMGDATTLGVTLAVMEHHTRCVRAGVERALLVADLPFGSYQSSVSQAVDSAVALVRAGADAVKLEGNYSDAIAAIIRAGIPVMGHVGMTPQSIHRFGGFRVQGKGAQADAVLEDARQVCEAGAFSMVLELIPAQLSRAVSDSVSCPTIGIGAGAECDGQIQVIYDVLGLADTVYKHAREFVDGRSMVTDGISRYADGVRAGTFPDASNSF